MNGRSLDAFAIHARFDGCVAEVRLNDVPLAGSSLRGGQSSVHASPWVIDGQNELCVVVSETRRLEILPMGATARDLEAGPVGAWARVMGGHYDDGIPDPERDATLAELRWGPLDDASRRLPQSLRASFTVGGRPRWAWQDAPRLAHDTPEVRRRVLQLVRVLHAAFAAGDGSGVLAHMGTWLREAVHFGTGDADFAQGFAGELSRVASEPGFAMDDYGDDDVVLRPIADGRVLRVLHAEGGSLLRSSPSSEEPFRFRLDLAEVDGTLEVVRIG